MDGCWLILDNDRVSRYHARFQMRGDVLSVEDLGSRNGTFVNGSRLASEKTLEAGDEVRIGNENIKVVQADSPLERIPNELRQTLGGTGDQDPLARALLAELAEKSLRVGNLKDAERFALALANQLTGRSVPVEDPRARACIHCMLGLSLKLNSGVWVDRLFHLFAAQRWIMAAETVTAVGETLDRILRLPSNEGILAYERTLRELEREGDGVPNALATTVAEWVDGYARA